MGFLYPDKVSRCRTSLVGCWTLRLVMCSMKILHLNWNSVASPKLASESAWLFSNLGTNLKSHRRILDFNLRTSCRYFFLLRISYGVFVADLVNSEQRSHWSSSPATLRVIAARSPAKIASYSALLLDARKPRVKDVWWWTLLGWWE